MIVLRIGLLVLVLLSASCANNGKQSHEKQILETIDKHYKSASGNTIEIKSYGNMDILKKDKSKNWTGSEIKYYYAGILKNVAGIANSTVTEGDGPNKGQVIYKEGDMVEGFYVTFRIQFAEKNGEITEIKSDEINCIPPNWLKDEKTKLQITQNLKDKPAFN